MCNPKLIYVFSGKRKSGKDFVAEKLQEQIGVEKCKIIRISGPLKSIYAKENNLDCERLLQSCEYKEKYRFDMIKWGEKKRNKCPEYFCKLAVEDSENKAVWIISDARRPSDIDFFVNNYKNVILVRIQASDEVRISRGWTFTEGVDNKVSECGLDSNISWDFIFTNNFSINEDELFDLKINELLLFKQTKHKEE